jgi:hypothetical protein
MTEEHVEILTADQQMQRFVAHHLQQCGSDTEAVVEGEALYHGCPLCGAFVTHPLSAEAEARHAPRGCHRARARDPRGHRRDVCGVGSGQSLRPSIPRARGSRRHAGRRPSVTSTPGAHRKPCGELQNVSPTSATGPERSAPGRTVSLGTVGSNERVPPQRQIKQP